MHPKLPQILLLQQMNTYLRKSPVDLNLLYPNLANIPS